MTTTCPLCDGYSTTADNEPCPACDGIGEVDIFEAARIQADIEEINSVR